MKNVSLIVNNTNAGYAPQPPMQQPAQQPVGAPFAQGKIFTVSFSAQFDDEAAAIKFAAELLNRVSGDAS